MGTTADKLNKLLATKEGIKAAIIEKGQPVSDSDSFASYESKIRAIRTSDIQLAEIAITKQPTKTSYTAKETFNRAGMEVKAVFSNDAYKFVTDFTTEPSGALKPTDTKVKVKYTEFGVTAEADVAVTVAAIKLGVPTQSGAPIYTGSTITPAWSGYDSSLMSISGSTSGTNAGSYTAVFSLKDKVNYTWADGTTADKSVAWSIGKAQASITIDKTSVVLNGDKLSETINISSVGMTSIMVMSSDMTVATASLNGNVLTISSVDETTGTATIVINGTVDSNYNAPEYPSIEVSAEFVIWPDDLDTGLEFVSASAFTISVASHQWDGTMEYCNGAEVWQTWDGSEISSGNGESGQCIYIRGTGNTNVSGDGTSYGQDGKWMLNGTNINCNGNIEKLLDYATVRAGGHPIMASYCYSYLFRGSTSLTTAPSLPATTLASYCYNAMFYGCTSLTTAPALPATTLADNCYGSMFSDCTSLKVAPALPATTLTMRCYSRMFQGCTSLTTAPALPTATLADYCYEFMFMDCTSLKVVPALPATTLTESCYYKMFYGCTKIKLSSTATDTYTKAYRIPKSGTGTTAIISLDDMFGNTGGTFTGAPKLNTTYYLDSSNTIV